MVHDIAFYTMPFLVEVIAELVLDRVTILNDCLFKNNIDMKTSLVDTEGFPLSNVDIYSVRRARNAIICAQNDRKKLTTEIEKAMLALHEQMRQSGQTFRLAVVCLPYQVC